MAERFGARLRQRREERGIDLVTIAQQTKIKPALLDALERDDVSQWPAGFYRRAFIRAYAQAVDLDPESVVREFLEVHPEPPEVDVIAAMALTLEGGLRSQGPAARVRDVVGLAMGSLSRLRRRDPEVVPPVEATSDELSSDRRPASPPPPVEPDVTAVARVCTSLGRAANAAEIQPLLPEAATLLDATGLIVWLWDPAAAALKPALVHGYSDQVIAQLPGVTRDADNATAVAFRTAQPCVVDGSEQARGALVVPLLCASGCAGVLAIELQRGREATAPLGAAAAILAAVLAPMTVQLGAARAGRVTAAAS
jgi:transcriptional regulator with XRE-family HTH domain